MRARKPGLSGRDLQDIPRLRTLRLVYDLTNEMIEDALWETKAEQLPDTNPESGSQADHTLSGGQKMRVISWAPGIAVVATSVFLFSYYRSHDLTSAQTLAFSAWIIDHIVMAFVSRSERESIAAVGIASAVALLLDLRRPPLFGPR